ISLTCHDYLIAYYEMNGFTDEGESESNHGGSTWYNMVWENPETH
ncbi:MAG: GNAT family N-acetyltransferase, partial [Streptococcus sp.]